MENNKILENRREFIKKAAYLLGVGIALPAASSIFTACEQDEGSIPTKPPETVPIKISDYPELNQVGGTKKVFFPGKNNDANIIITRIDQNNFSVLDSTCTHAGCEIPLASGSSNEMKCPCHFVVFSNIDGSVKQNPVSGWSSVPLKKYDSQFDAANNILKLEI